MSSTSRSALSGLAVVAALTLAVSTALLAVPRPSAAGAASTGSKGPGLFLGRTPTQRHLSWVVRGVLNRERAAHGLRPLHMNRRLVVSARKHNLRMGGADELVHQVRGEASVARRVSAAGYRWSWVGENIGYNTVLTRGGVVALEHAMYNERPPDDGHRRNILNRHFSDVGVDVYLDRGHHRLWLTVDFGHR